MENSRKIGTINSALWAAYGDVLGFPTELVDAEGVKRRLGSDRISRPHHWKRLVGGRMGAWVTLPAGTYSDDTQLRLATSRAIRQDGHFDVEAFAKIELPVWLAYSLGAGRGSKIGATALSQRTANWFSNFFEQRGAEYTAGGGNGAAMRIQPHVWAARDPGNPDSYLPHVVQNAVCTHGHPRGIAGAAIHAGCLAYVLKNSHLPPPDNWGGFGFFCTLATEYIEGDPDLNTFWLPTWNRRTQTQFAEEMERVRIEWEQHVAVCLPLLKQNTSTAYKRLVQELGGFTPEERGSGLKSALFALAAAWIFKDQPTELAISEVVNLLLSDTDTIGTMTGALLGALQSSPPPGPIQDADYISYEAIRLYNISQGKTVESFNYPDLIKWQPPKVQLDVVGRIEGSIAVAGLGFAEELSEELLASGSDATWQWLKLKFGQTILCKRRRKQVEQLLFSNLPIVVNQNISREPSQGTLLKDPTHEIAKKSSQVPNDLFQQETLRTINNLNDGQNHSSSHNRAETFEKSPIKTLEDLTDEAIRSNFDPRLIGVALMNLAEHPDGIERAIAYAAIIVKARQARLRRNRGE